MLVSFNWLKKHVDLGGATAPEEVAEKLMARTVEVEKIFRPGKDLENIVVGKVLKSDKHLNADKLKVCLVDIGREKATVVCGGSNVKEGMLVALAKVGAKVRWHGEGEPVELKPTAIRGVESFGMICASTEIGLAGRFPLKEEKEILDLTFTKAKAGLALAEALGLDDAILEIDNKSLSHRPDLFGYHGLAREVSVLFHKKFKEYKIKKISRKAGSAFGGKKIDLKVKVEDAKLCPRYMAVALEGVKVGESPEWMKKSLAAAGVNPINNIVDATNYVMLDLGQPLHAFDADKLAINNKQLTIKVRTAKTGENIAVLDGKEISLDEETLVIADEEKPLAIAGVKGGKDSGIGADTTAIILESANFSPAAIRRASAKYGLRTDSAIRFEKSLDPNWCEEALSLAVELILKICPGAKVASQVADVSDFVLSTGPVQFSLSELNERLGNEFNQKAVVNILESLGFKIKIKSGPVFSATIPTWRATKDICIPEDIFEEVARVHGFNNLRASLPSFPINPPPANETRVLERKISGVLVNNLGYTEVYNYSFVSAGQINKIGDDAGKYIELANPLSKEKPFLRRSLLLNMLENAEAGLNTNEEIKIFETGKVFRSEVSGAREKTNGDGLLPRQDTMLTLIFSSKKVSTPFYEARRAAEEIFSSLCLPFEAVSPESDDKILPYEHPGRSALLRAGDKTVGMLSELRPAVAEKFGLKTRAGLATINLDTLSEVLINHPPKIVYRPLPVYPEAERDIAFLAPADTKHADIIKVLLKSDNFLKKAELFDVYTGKETGEAKKSLAYRLTFGKADRTLTTEEVDKAVLAVTLALQEKFGVEIRK